MQKEGEEKQLDFFAGKFDTSDDNNTPIEKLERTEKINRVLHFISLLPEDARTLIKMKFEEKLCYREISQKTGLTEGNVGYKLHHLLRSLAEELKSEGIIA
jgi:RNA polymerase sigma-70 factor (ECF subfamily)